MAITSISDLNVFDAVEPASGTEIVATGPVAIYADGLVHGEYVDVYRLGTDGTFYLLRDENGPIRLSQNPNTVLIDIANTYRLGKTVTTYEISVGYELQ